ncbi:hypothetical protein [Deinococcus alpinitundrae]|uniref:hypothetical protein n=1 Tax=Deinococcus alpinitundrae TaxID=468913 RepID=UPI00137962EB|nr:hypothetical protein [Deinococcus alpinitundrae]
MNTINVSGAGLSFAVLAAALILVLGVWRKRRDLGMRGMWGTLGTLALISLCEALLVSPGFMGLSMLADGGFVGLALFSLLNLALAFMPLYVAANWVEVILRQTRPPAEP